jgi:hypothetical protein
MMGILGWLAGVLFLLWVAGFLLRLGGILLYALLIVSIIMFAVDFIFRSRRGGGRTSQ